MRIATDDDIGAVADLVTAVGWPHRVGDIAMMMALGRGLVLPAGDSGQLAGAGFWWPWGEEAATVGLVIVSPRRQGEGLGRRLMEGLLDDVGARAVQLVATEAGRPLYERLGFRVVGAIQQRQGRRTGDPPRGDRLPDDPAAGESLRDARPDDVDALVRLDAAAFGADRRALVERLLEVGHATVSERSGEPDGFAVVREFGRGQVVGPVVAVDEEAAVALFHAVAPTGFVRLDLAADAHHLAGAAEAAGLAVVDQPPVMVLGRWPEPAGPRTFGLAGHAFG